MHIKIIMYCNTNWDGDGQHNPVYIKDMIEIMKKEHINMAIGSRFVEKTSYKQNIYENARN